MRNHSALRWSVPACVAGVLGLAAGGVFTAQASSRALPGTTPTALLADVSSAHVNGLSGTIVAQMSLGLPELPSVSGDAGQLSAASLLSGSHTMRFWYGGVDRQRVALLGTTSETDVFRSGRDVWQWDSDAHVATHSLLPAGHSAAPDASGITPQQVAERAIAAIDPSTQVTVGGTRQVADRSAYDLVLTPRDPATRVGSVHIAIDGATKIPLGVQVYPRGDSHAAIDVAFSDVSFKKPSADNFSFTPPPGATVQQGTPHDQGIQAYEFMVPAADDAGMTITGGGWTTVAEYHVSPVNIGKSAGPLLGHLAAVDGAWGHGRLLDSALVSVLITDDGRVFAGAVEPSALYAAAATRK